MELAAAICAFLTDRARRCTPHSVAWYASQLALFAHWLSARQQTDVCALTPADLSEYVCHLRSRPLQNNRAGAMSRVTAAQYAKALRTFIRYCERECCAPPGLAQSLPIPSPGRRIPRALPLAQARLLLSAPLSARDRAAIALMLDAGPRLAEVAGLDVVDVDLDERTALIRHGKGDKARVIVFGSEAAADLRAWLAVRNGAPTPALFLARGGTRITPSGLYKVVKNAAAQVGLASVVRPHVLRHTYATCALDADAPLSDIQQQLGHEHIATTLIYAQVSRAGLRRRHEAYSPLRRMRGG